MQCTHREMCSQEEVSVEDHMEEEGGRSYGEQGAKTLEEKHKTTGEDRG